MSQIKGLKYDSKKDRWDLLTWRELKEVVKVFTFGAKKYGDYNWQQVAWGKQRYFAAAMRHITDWQQGEIRDRESGLHHLAHAITCFLFIMWREGPEEPKTEVKHGYLDFPNNPDLVVDKTPGEEKVEK